jgi:hypothetical protein
MMLQRQILSFPFLGLTKNWNQKDADQKQKSQMTQMAHDLL